MLDSHPTLPLTDHVSFRDMDLPSQIKLLEPRVHADLLAALMAPDLWNLFELLGVPRQSVITETMSTPEFEKWAAVVELSYVLGLTTGRVIASGFRPGGAK